MRELNIFPPRHGRGGGGVSKPLVKIQENGEKHGMKHRLVLSLLLVAVAGCGKSSPPVEPSRSETAPAPPPAQPTNTNVARPATDGIVTQALETVTAAAESAAAKVRDQAAALATEAQQQAQTVITQLTTGLDQISTQTQSQLQEIERTVEQQTALILGNANAPAIDGLDTNQPSAVVSTNTNMVPTNAVRALETNAAAVVTNAVQETQKALDRLLVPRRTGSQ